MSYSLKELFNTTHYVITFSRQGDFFMELVPKDPKDNMMSYQTSQGIINAAIFPLKFEAEIFLKEHIKDFSKENKWTEKKTAVYLRAHYKIMTLKELFDDRRWWREQDIVEERRKLGKTIYDN